MGSVLVSYPEKRRNHIDFQTGLVSNVTGAERKVEVLHEEENVRDVVDPLPQTRIRGRFTSNRSDKSRYLRTISVPGRKIEREYN